MHRIPPASIANSTSFLATYLRGTPPFNFESTEFSEINCKTRQTKMAAPIMRCIFFVFVPRWTFYCRSEMLLHTWLHCCLVWSPIYALHSLAVRAIHCQVLLFVFELVANVEANVVNNNNDWSSPTCRVAMPTKTNGNAISATSQEITSQEPLVRVVYDASRTHH